jgi:hypothetical protein
MELKSFIQEVLSQMEDLKGDKLKKNYSVAELEMELLVTGITGGKLDVVLFNAELKNQNAQKVKVRLVPKIEPLRKQASLKNDSKGKSPNKI